MSAREKWLNEGLSILAEQGPSGIRIDKIATRLGLTKGSFHHHFTGIADYQQQLCERYETESMAMLEQLRIMAAEMPAADALMKLPGRIVVNPRIEAAVRGWALDNESVRAVQQRLDTTRLDALIGVWQQIVADPQRARAAALVPHLIVIGAAVALPAPSTDDLRGVFELLAELVPSVAHPSSDG